MPRTQPNIYFVAFAVLSQKKQDCGKGVFCYVLLPFGVGVIWEVLGYCLRCSLLSAFGRRFVVATKRRYKENLPPPRFALERR